VFLTQIAFANNSALIVANAAYSPTIYVGVAARQQATLALMPYLFIDGRERGC
jgi:hypothetical protein